MFRHAHVFAGILLAILAFAALGCGGAADAEKGSASKGSSNPFGSAGDVDELRGPSDGRDDDGPSYSADDLKVPGARYGLKTGAEAAKKCPKGKKGRKCRAAAKKEIPFTDGIAEQMEGIPWGMHYKAVMAQFEKRIRDSFKEELKSAGGAIEEDRVRSKMMREVNEMKKSYVKFDGSRSGFEGVLVGEEFTHHNGESMLSWDAGKFVEYLFFFDGRFWKRLRTFRKDSLKGNITFEDYKNTLVNRFGEGQEKVDDVGNLIEIIWQDDESYMAARDKSGFYGVFCLVFMARLSQDNIARLRPTGDKEEKPSENVSAMVEAVTSGDLSDHSSSVIDSYTGTGTGTGRTKIDTHHSVMSKKKKKKGSEEGSAATEEKKEEPREDGSDSLDDIF